MNNLEFSPADGLMNKTSFPTDLGSETEARQQFMTLFNQLKTFMNDEIVNSLNNKNTEFTVNGDNWYWKDKNTGLIRQGGTKVIPFNNQNAASVNISFPKIFPSLSKSCLFISGSILINIHLCFLAYLVNSSVNIFNVSKSLKSII